ncbi:MAG: MGH1-like glycoside hydrolase domain-containing protein [Jatrophihabitans sp.]
MSAEPGAAPPTTEHARLAESPAASSPWREWGPYLSGRQWGTVREDYSADGDAWGYLPFEQAHARAYRWGEDGLGGICDSFGFLNFSIALWNGRDPILKERLYGLANPQGNHGEDAKEYWWALDGTPTHSWMQWLYRYPQAAFPYERLRTENAARTRADREFELADTGVLDQNRFFDITVSYAKAAPDDLCVTIGATNHGPEPAPLHLLPQIWFRNTWAWGDDDRRPALRALPQAELAVGDIAAVECRHDYLGRYVLAADSVGADRPDVLVCSNETNAVALFGAMQNESPHPKDSIGRRVVDGDATACAADGLGTKAAFWYRFDAVAPGESVKVSLRLSRADPAEDTFGAAFDAVVADRRAEADAFYGSVLPGHLSAEDRTIARRAFAGLLWGKQVYRYSVRDWLAGDSAQPPAPAARRAKGARNTEWTNLALADVISMPDEWEYPWFAAWDLAFHCVALAHVDPQFAKDQLVLMCREWAMHPDGQLPAYEWAFGDVNPPVHAWAAWQVYVTDGKRDRDFLITVFTKLLLNFSWWVNRKDADGSNLFSGGFLGMDNIGAFDRSAPLPDGYELEQSDATSWMAFFCLSMVTIALELARADQVWDDLATKFLEHFLAIAHAVHAFGPEGTGIWNDEDGFCYDVLVKPDGSSEPMRIRSMVGLLPVLAVAMSEPWVSRTLPDFTGRLRWLVKHRPELTQSLLSWTDETGVLGMLSLLDPVRLDRVLQRMLDPHCFLSEHGIRSLSAEYRTSFTTTLDGQEFSIDYEPGESRTPLFGGNSNWRGPVWFPVNVLLSDALRTYGAALPTRTVPFPTRSDSRVGYAAVADALDQRLIDLFRVGANGRRPSDGQRIEASADPVWQAHVTFSEYFDGDTGEGLGATHQTGWTALVAHLLCRPDPG